MESNTSITIYKGDTKRLTMRVVSQTPEKTFLDKNLDGHTALFAIAFGNGEIFQKENAELASILSDGVNNAAVFVLSSTETGNFPVGIFQYEMRIKKTENEVSEIFTVKRGWAKVEAPIGNF